MLLRIASVLLGLLLITGAPTRAQAQDAGAGSAGPFARIVVIQPKPGQDEAFEAGYQRHLAWHRAHQDPWNWYGWSFVLGERLGLFMDGTFGHAAEALDHPVDPAGDGADNAANVVPTADFLSHAVYQRLDSVSSEAAVPDTMPYLALTTYRVRPGRERRFEAALAAAHGHRRSMGAPEPAYAWLRLAIGGAQPEYLLLRPVRSWAAAATLPDFFRDRPETVRALEESIVGVRSELLRYRPDMSYHP